MRSEARQRGSVMIEAAIAFPVILVLLVGVVEYAWCFLRAHQVSSAAREGARAGIRADGTSTQVVAAVDGAMTAYGLGSSGYSVSSTSVVVAAGETVQVDVSVTYEGNLELLGLLPMPATLNASVVMAKEGP